MTSSDDGSDPKHTLGPASRVDAHPAGERGTVERRSPPTDRVVQVLNLLADSPRERFSLTQIATRLGLNKPTCLGVLTELTDAAFVTRDDAKSYGLGPALLRLGSAAETGLANPDVIRPLWAELFDRLGVGCILHAARNGHSIILDVVGNETPAGERHDLIGARYPLAPPIGLVNIAWEQNSVVDEWVNRPSVIPLVDNSIELVHAIINAGRERGYIVECAGSSASSTTTISGLLASRMPQRIIDQIRQHLPPEDWSEYVVTLPADPNAPLPVTVISAPIFDRHGSQIYTLSLVPDPSDGTVALCKEWGSALAETADSVTTALRR